MDVKKITDGNEYASFFKQLLATAELAARRKVRHLQWMMISAMKLETHHRGTKTLLRVLTPPDRINAVMAVVEDQEGTAVLLQLYHLPEETVVPADHVLCKDRVCILKEAFFKATTDGTYSLRVDHVNDIIWLADDDEHIPAKWRRQRLAVQQASLEARMQGNKAVSNNDWAKAERLYSSAISAAETSEESMLALLNRSLANLRLGRFENALSDATRGTVDKEPSESEKALFREARALYEMRNYKECMGRLVVLTKEFPGNNAVKPELDRTQARLREQQFGEFSFRRIYQQAKAKSPVIDCATYSGPVEIRPSPGRGRGLFTSAAVAAGDLLGCEKAFAYSYAGDDQPEGIRNTTLLMDVASKRFTVGGQAHLISQIVQKLLHNPESSKEFLDLHPGKYQAVSTREVDGRPVVDSFLVVQIILANVFGAPRTSRSSFRTTTLELKKPSTSHTTCGIWILASHLNHSCVGNCRRSFIGDMQIIRATRDIPADTELFFSYRHAETMASYTETQKKLENWDFKCGCALCLDKKVTSDDTLKRRKALLSQLKTVMRPSINPRSVDTKRALAVLEKMEASYATPVRKEPSAADLSSSALATVQITPRLELLDPYLGLGRLFLTIGKPADSVKVTVKCLEALGFVINAPPPGSTRANTSPPSQLVLEAWGMVDDLVVLAFMQLFHAYMPKSPELASRAREYAATAYSMMVGEKETVFEEIPELC
ncbi:Uu.00g090200.m01.CDS01 [Anthostomella pinea]|uniref:Uu.00g090200.m01.CDS01 n=1 Tax=Anthostomella pinea TaxID=933095 RepID=A0AAI8VMW1_9PEZI|nr:Uu.00g090200.m01.CDS01 [Anthostomella pinea]